MRNRILQLSLVIGTVLCCAGASHALMPYYAGARALGMGNAFSSLANEAAALYWNPAGLGDLKGAELTAMLTQDGLDTQSSFAAYAQPVGDWGGVAAGWSRTGNTFEKTDAWGTSLGESEAANNVYMAGISYYRDWPVSFGLTAKYYNEKIDTFVLNGWSLDAGLLIDRCPFRFALVGRNIASGGLSGESYSGGSTVHEEIAPAVRAGMSYMLNKVCIVEGGQSAESETGENMEITTTLALDAELPLEENGKLSVDPGAELWFNNIFALRGGVRDLKDYTAGMSLKLSLLRLDYAFIYSQSLESTHILSTSLFF